MVVDVSGDQYVDHEKEVLACAAGDAASSGRRRRPYLFDPDSEACVCSRPSLPGRLNYSASGISATLWMTTSVPSKWNHTNFGTGCPDLVMVVNQP